MRSLIFITLILCLLAPAIMAQTNTPTNTPTETPTPTSTPTDTPTMTPTSTPTNTPTNTPTPTAAATATPAFETVSATEAAALNERTHWFWKDIGIGTFLDSLFDGDFGSRPFYDVQYRTVRATAATTTVNATDSGTMYLVRSGGSSTFTLPTARAGLHYTFIDDSGTAADDLIVGTQTLDKLFIGDNTAGADSMTHSTDADNYAIIEVIGIAPYVWTVKTTGTW